MSEKFGDWAARSTKAVGKDIANVGDALREAGERIKPSFAHAHKELQNGQMKPMAMKVGSVAVGAYLTAHGINNVVRGTLEEVEHPAHDGRTVQNTTRIFWGAGETLAGATALYFGLTKGKML